LLWRNRDYMLFWSGRTISALGTSTSGIAFPLLILALTRSPALAGLAGALRAAPYVLLSLPAGALVDRWDRKRVMLLCDTSRALILGSIPLAWWAGRLSLAQLYAATTIEGTLLLFYNTANLSALPRLVRQEQLGAASAQDEGAYYAASLLGPAVGGVLYQIARALPFLADALSYLVSVLSLLLIKTDLRQDTDGGARPRHLGADMLEGLVWLWRQPIIRAVSMLDAADTLVVSNIGLVVIVLAQQHHATPTTIGAIFAVAGIGGVLGSVAGGVHAKAIQLRADFDWGALGLGRAVAALCRRAQRRGPGQHYGRDLLPQPHQERGVRQLLPPSHPRWIARAGDNALGPSTIRHGGRGLRADGSGATIHRPTGHDCGGRCNCPCPGD